MNDTVLDQLLHPSKLWSRAEVLQRPSPVPREPGVYGWYFRGIPPSVPTDGCHRHADLTLLYVGISPRRAPENGVPPSRQQLRKRVSYHFRGNAEGSTLRLTLGCLLSEHLQIQLRRVGSGTRRTFSVGEAALSRWMDENAFVCWAQHPDPRSQEEQLIHRLILPLNLEGNSHPYRPLLSAIRSAAKRTAEQLPIA